MLPPMQIDLLVHEEKLPGWKTQVCHGDMASFWPLSPADNMMVLAGSPESRSSSIPFNFRKSDFVVLQLDNEVGQPS